MDISMDISREYQKQKRCPMQPKFRQNPRLRIGFNGFEISL